MFIAVTSGREVLEVATNEAASLDGMAAYSRLGRPALRRIVTTAAVWSLWAGGAMLETDLEIVNDRPVTIIREVSR